MVSSIISDIIMCLAHILCFTYIIIKIENKKINPKNIKLIFWYILLLIFTMLTYKVFNNLLRPITMFISYALIFKKIFNIRLSTSLIDCFLGYIVTALSEIIQACIIFIIFKIPENIINTYIVNKPLGSIFSAVIMIILTKILYKFLIRIKKSINIEKNTNLLWIIVIVLSASLSLYINNSQLNLTFIATTISSVLTVIIIFFLLKEINTKHELKNEYDKLFNYNKDSESLLTKYQKYNHENKNQLILIRETLSNKEETKKLINEILEDDVEHKNKWLDDLKNIPSGGLKGLMSYKINYMSDKGINVYVSISPRLKDIEISKKINMKTYKELCQMIGIYMDNAYEASIETNEKIVSIEMYYQDDIVNIVISNTFNKKIDLESIDKVGYSTKGRERGIGLSLAKDIASKNKKISVKREIIQNYYYQYTNLDVS